MLMFPCCKSVEIASKLDIISLTLAWASAAPTAQSCGPGIRAGIPESGGITGGALDCVAAAGDTAADDAAETLAFDVGKDAEGVAAAVPAGIAALAFARVKPAPCPIVTSC